MTAFVVALVAAGAVTPLVIVGLRRSEMIDVPNHRSSHAEPVPRGGGIAVSFATVAGLLVGDGFTLTGVALSIGALALAVTGLLDDRLDLPATPRLIVQFVTPLVAALAITERGGLALPVGVAIAVVATAGYVNAFNFMDGINAISGLQTIVAGVFIAAVAARLDAGTVEVAGWAVAGAALGFLPFNAPIARTFLGDVGSYFLGFWLAGSALILLDEGVSPLVVVAPFLLYLADTSTVLVRRARRGESLTEAHREHSYQRLTQAGWGHVRVAGLCAAVAGTCAAVMYLSLDGPAALRHLAFVACLAVVALYVGLPDAIARSRAQTDPFP